MALTVNGDRIEDDAIQAEVMRLQRVGPDVAEELEEIESEEQLREHATENLVIRELLRQDAAETIGDLPKDEVDAGVQEMMDEHGGKSAFYAQFGLSEEDESSVREHVENSLRVPKLFEVICKDVAAPTRDEVRQFYDDNPARFLLPPQIRVAHIVKRPDDEGDTYQEMVSLRRKLKRGADFAAVADEHSECQEEPGGDLGFFPRGQMVEEFETIAFSMDIGEISPVFQTQFGYHLATVSDKKDSMRRPFEDAREQIAESLLNDRKNDTIGEHVEKLREKATIVEESAVS